MAKDPAFLFYSQDFLVGVATLSYEDRGKYITILAQMHQSGRMDEETIRFLVGSVSVKLKSKFRIDDHGMWYNERLEREASARAQFTESRRKNGLLGGRPKASGKAKQKLVVNHTDNRMEDENENENSIKKESALIFPIQFSTARFAAAWKLWVTHRKQIGKAFKSTMSQQTALSKLFKDSGNSEAKAIEMIEVGISNGYQGLFPKKETNAVKKDDVPSVYRKPETYNDKIKNGQA